MGKEIEFSRDQKLSVVDFFLVGGQPALMYGTAEKGSKELTYFVQRYNGADLTPLDAPLKMGSLTFVDEAGGAQRYLVGSKASPDGEHIAYLYEHMSEPETSKWIATCWVLNTATGTVEWTASYTLPVLNPSSSWISVDNNGHVLVNANVKDYVVKGEKAKEYPYVNGEDRTTKNHYQWFRMTPDGYQHWDGRLPNGRALVRGEVKPTADGIVIGGFLDRPDRKAPQQWYIATMDDEFRPEQKGQGDVQTDKLEAPSLHDMEVAEDGRLALGAVFGENTAVVVISATGELERTLTWPTSMPDITLFWRGDRLYHPFNGFESDVADALAGKKTKAGYRLRPILMSWDIAGKLSVVSVIPEEHGADRDVITHGGTNSTSMAQHGLFVDYDYSKQGPGIIVVPFE